MHEVENSLDQFKVGTSYQTEEFIGHGTTGVIYKGRNTQLDTPVAIKILNPELSKNDKFMQFLNNEIKAVFKLNHPHIVNVKETGRENDKFYIIMEYVDGKSLDRFLAENGPPPVEDAVLILQQLALAIDYANGNDVVHKAIKPQNILVTSDKQVKLTGFGLSKAMATAWLTITGTSAAHVEYLSPEQAEGENVDYRCDIYSFGIIAYQLLAGEVPFKKEGSSILNLAMKHINTIPALPSSLNPLIPNWLELIVMKCLEKKPDKRYNSGKEIFEALKNQGNYSSNTPASRNNEKKDEIYSTPVPQTISADELEETLKSMEQTSFPEKIRQDLEKLDELSYPEQISPETAMVKSETEKVEITGVPQKESTGITSNLKNQNQLKMMLFIVIILELVIISIFVYILLLG